MTTFDVLPPLKSPSGHDGYCHVCWNDVYRFWVAKESPDYDRCPMGDFTAQTCPDATGRARNVAMIQQLKDDGLWPFDPKNPGRTTTADTASKTGASRASEGREQASSSKPREES